MRSIRRKVIVALGVCLMTATMASPIFAYSSSASANLPNTNYKVQSNVWQSNTYFWETHNFAVSAKLLNKSTNAAVTASEIKSTWSFRATGVGVSVKGVSGSTGGSTFSGSYLNKNAWISDMSGTFKIGGAPLYSSFDNTAYALKSGVKAQTSASCFRFY